VGVRGTVVGAAMVAGGLEMEVVVSPSGT
jgi:hypothetical protein